MVSGSTGIRLRTFDIGPYAGWRPARPALPMQSGILLLHSRHQHTQIAPDNVVRESLLASGTDLTMYDGGTVQASLPDRPLAGTGLK